MIHRRPRGGETTRLGQSQERSGVGVGIMRVQFSKGANDETIVDCHAQRGDPKLRPFKNLPVGVGLLRKSPGLSCDKSSPVGVGLSFESPERWHSIHPLLSLQSEGGLPIGIFPTSQSGGWGIRDNEFSTYHIAWVLRVDPTESFSETLMKQA